VSDIKQGEIRSVSSVNPHYCAKVTWSVQLQKRNRFSSLETENSSLWIRIQFVSPQNTVLYN